MTALEVLEKVKEWYEKNKDKAVYMFATEYEVKYFINTSDMEELRKILGLPEEEKDMY